MSIKSIVNGALKGMTPDEILAIDPSFGSSVESANKTAISDMEHAEALAKEAAAKLASSERLKASVERVQNAVTHFRKITGGK